ncbi:hypothetical protein G4X40_13135 [Rhodococcus sp. D2-41]|nr:hypothetical protein [Rhodococcus sp. D2-41]
MPSDREEIPEGFTKADADKAETMEARLQTSTTRAGVSPLVAPGCQAYWPAPYEVCGAIKDKYNSLGGPNSFLKYPISAELTNPGNTGKRSEFMVGPIYWSAATGAHPIVNSFMTKWGSLGWEGGYLRYPTTDEIVNPDGVGRRQEFQGGAIYWHPVSTVNGAAIGGAIRDKWNTVQAERPGSLLGYPTSDETVLPDGQGRMNRFERGVIYWSPTTGAHPVVEPILNAWANVGYERSSYGYPTADMTSDPAHIGGVVHQFQHGPLAVQANLVPVSGNSHCHGQDITGCVPSGPSVLDDCVQHIIVDDNANLALYNGGQYRLECGDFRNHISKHFSHPNEISDEDGRNFFKCTSNALIFGVPADADMGDGHQTRYINSGVQGFVVTRGAPYFTIYTAYTSGDGGNDWGGCVRDSS